MTLALCIAGTLAWIALALAIALKPTTTPKP